MAASITSVGGYIEPAAGGTLTSDQSATATSHTGTTLKLQAPAGKYPGNVNVTKTDANFTAANIANGVSLFGISGTLSSGTAVSADQAATTNSHSGTTLKFEVPAGLYSGSTNVTQTDANFVNTNIASGVTLFGLAGTMAAGASPAYIVAGCSTGAGNQNVNDSYFRTVDGPTSGLLNAFPYGAANVYVGVTYLNIIVELVGGSFYLFPASNPEGSGVSSLYAVLAWLNNAGSMPNYLFYTAADVATGNWSTSMYGHSTDYSYQFAYGAMNNKCSLGGGTL